MSDSCAICFENLNEKTKAKLDGCSHEFCFDCIKKWATEKSNKCPMCKTRFTELHSKDEKTGEKIVTKIDQKDLDDSENSEDSEEFIEPTCILCEDVCLPGPTNSYNCLGCFHMHSMFPTGNFIHKACLNIPDLVENLEPEVLILL
jgi:hypothetical protein